MQQNNNPKYICARIIRNFTYHECHQSRDQIAIRPRFPSLLPRRTHWRWVKSPCYHYHRPYLNCQDQSVGVYYIYVYNFCGLFTIYGFSGSVFYIFVVGTEVVGFTYDHSLCLTGTDDVSHAVLRCRTGATRYRQEHVLPRCVCKVQMHFFVLYALDDGMTKKLLCDL